MKRVYRFCLPVLCVITCCLVFHCLAHAAQEELNRDAGEWTFEYTLDRRPITQRLRVEQVHYRPELRAWSFKIHYLTRYLNDEYEISKDKRLETMIIRLQPEMLSEELSNLDQQRVYTCELELAPNGSASQVLSDGMESMTYLVSTAECDGDSIKSEPDISSQDSLSTP